MEVMNEEDGVVEVLCCTIMASARGLFNETRRQKKKDLLGEKLLQRKKPVWCVFWIEQTSVFGPKVQQNVYIIVKPFKIIMSCHGLLKHPDCQLQNKVKLAEKGRKMYNNVISD